MKKKAVKTVPKPANGQRVEDMIHNLNTEMNTQFAVLHARIGDLRTDVASRFDSLNRDMRDFWVTLKQHDDRLTKLERPDEDGR